MKKSYLYIIAAVLTLIPLVSNAQSMYSNDLMYHSFRSPVITRLNPAFFPDSSRFYIAFPRIDIGGGMPLSYREIGIYYDASQDRSIINLNHVIDKLRENGTHFGITTEAELMHFGFKVKQLSFNVAAGIRFTGNLNVPIEASRLLTEGNMGSAGHIEMGIQDFLLAQTYGYASLGAAYTFPKINLTVGGRLNMQDGTQVLSADHLSLDYRNINNDELQLSADYVMQSAGLVGLEQDSAGVYHIVRGSKFPKSLGCTFDLGVKYEIKGFTISASVIDLGPGIHWTESPLTIVPKHQDRVIHYSGIDLEQLVTEGVVDSVYGQSITDSIMAMIDTSISRKSFWTGVPTKVYLGASYSLKNMLRFGVLFHGEWDRGTGRAFNTFRQNTMLSVNFNLFDWLELAVANSFTFDGKKFDAINPGFSASFNIARRFQMYFTVDYLSHFYVVDMKSFRAMMGFNIVDRPKVKKIKQRKLKHPLIEENGTAGS